MGESKISANFVAVLDKVGDLTLSSVWDEANTEKGKKRVLNLKLLIKSIASGILALSGAGVKIDAEDLAKVNDFLNNLATSVEKFCNFLDYDGDGVVELVDRNEKGEVVEGEDIKLMIEDGKKVTSTFKKQGDIQTTVFAVISSLLTYFTSEHITQTKDDFVEFKDACETTYNSMKLIKEVDHNKFFAENSKDLMKFIVTLCIVIVPVVDLVSFKISQINNSDDVDADKAVLSKEDIKKAVLGMYGVNLEFVLSTVESLITVFLKSFESSATGKKFIAYMRSKCCCGASKTN
ncbi:hypothetical protein YASMINEVIRUS_498 [Yasminevirus sp. GU-2018]|uniref:Uncharacterized protein n=1 Tax=Yasminevirus sp. GU-2018 TaxID=2420051 RepID=A0A5K0U895_9VIRU|nr:hypothetical protein YASMINEVIRUS_498 [Yasminevirus sp. GU-2018]